MTATAQGKTASVGLLLIRVFLGFGLAAHGYQKFSGEQGVAGFAGYLKSMGVPAPNLAAYLSAGTELAGGVLVGIGLFTRLAALPVAFNMFVAAFMAHGSAYFINSKPPGMEYTLNLGVVFLAVVLLGPGRYSLDHAFFGRRRRLGG